MNSKKILYYIFATIGFLASATAVIILLVVLCFIIQGVAVRLDEPNKLIALSEIILYSIGLLFLIHAWDKVLEKE
ncbi:hypothetical protein J7K74_03735 [Candidatus Woesearchaeota archaeon]|nr:hypothetical protein [Candidatus Woesearchaeota archaeon]